MIDFPDEDLALAGLRGPLQLADVLFQAKKSQRIAPLQVVRADRVVGPDHVRQAARCARRAIAQGRAQANSLETEFLRYLAAERQVKSALAKMGLPEVADSAVAVAFGPKRLDALQHFAEALGADEDDSLAEASLQKLQGFGITETALAATTPARRLDLALEAVAAVDLMTR
jgi:tRNA threonylcarbamoyladenosine modification (KEOPS) complex Cgi121 subunit